MGKALPLSYLTQAFESLFKKDHWGPLPPVVSNPAEGFLCPDAHNPHEAKDKVCIDCQMDQGSFGPSKPPAFNGELVVGSYNLERGMFFEKQVELMKHHPDLSKVEVWIINEADRGCSRTGCRNVARDLAKALGMNFAFGVELVELPRESKLLVNFVDKVCEHGNAILSRYPLKNVRQIRHSYTENWYHRPDQPRLGGSLSLAADIQLGKKQLSLRAIHFASGPQGEPFRRHQASEMVKDLAHHSGPALIGGDMNTMLYTLDVLAGTQLDQTIKLLKNSGYTDCHQNLKATQRATTDNTYGIAGVIDLVFARGVQVLEAGVVKDKSAQGLSDHFPIWAKLKI